MTKSIFADIRIIEETLEKVYQERKFLREELKKAREKIKCLEKNDKKPPPVRRKSMKMDRPRKVINEKVRAWAVRTRARELGLKNVKSWKVLYQKDPCVSNEREFYRSYLEDYNNIVIKKNKH
jgi:hypothetical protein